MTVEPSPEPGYELRPRIKRWLREYVDSGAEVTVSRQGDDLTFTAKPADGGVVNLNVGPHAKALPEGRPSS